jgi:hypothetical protein
MPVKKSEPKKTEPKKPKEITKQATATAKLRLDIEMEEK